MTTLNKIPVRQFTINEACELLEVLASNHDPIYIERACKECGQPAVVESTPEEIKYEDYDGDNLANTLKLKFGVKDGSMEGTLQDMVEDRLRPD